MSRIQARFTQLKQAGRKALIPYITAGDSNPAVTVPLMHAMVRAGADIIEVGVPFSDPMADGPVIQLACERALKHNVSLTEVLAMVTEFRKTDSATPVVLMGYLNPIEVMGYASFATKAKAAGVDGVLTVDLPPEEAGDLTQLMADAGLDPIYLLAPTSSDERLALIARASRGFVYYVSLKGVTGVAAIDVESVAAKLTQVRRLTSLPVGVGFGIRDGASAAAVAKVADAVVVGSAIVRLIEASQSSPSQIIENVSAFVAELRTAIDHA